MMIMNEEMCVGCKGSCVREHEYKTPIGTILTCPCSMCIIKVMCKSGCDAYSDYVEEIDRFKHIEELRMSK